MRSALCYEASQRSRSEPRHLARLASIDRPSLSFTQDALVGDWKLLFTTSPSFVFNGGFTGVAATTPGGASFESLNQKLIRTPVGFLEVSLVQPLSAKRRTVKIAPAERCRTKKTASCASFVVKVRDVLRFLFVGRGW